MNLIYISAYPATPWRDALARHLPEAAFFAWGEDDVDLAAIDYALVWKPEHGLLCKFPNLKAAFNLGAGVDVLLRDETLPRNVPVVRLVDPALATGMAEYVVHWVLHFHRDMHLYAHQQAARTWAPRANADTRRRRIGLLGFGELGRAAARTLLALGFEDLAGWSRTRKTVDGVKSYAGDDELAAFLSRTDILVCILPETARTRGLLNARTLAHLPPGAFLINAGRGAAVDDVALLEALNAGRVQGAALDVFNTEPLPPDHPYWSTANVFITPHIASLTAPDSATRVIAQDIRILENGGMPANVVDVDQGY